MADQAALLRSVVIVNAMQHPENKLWAQLLQDYVTADIEGKKQESQQQQDTGTQGLFPCAIMTTTTSTNNATSSSTTSVNTTSSSTTSSSGTIATTTSSS